MKILQLAPPWVEVPPVGYGGIEWIVAALADGLSDAGHEVTLLASGGSRTNARLQTVFDAPPFPMLGDARIEAIHALTGYLDRHSYDLIHDHTAAVGPVLAAVADGPPVVHTLHRPWDLWLEWWARKVAPPVHLVAISHDQARSTPTGIPITAVVHNGVPIDLYPYQERKEDYLLFVGRAHHDKGPEVAIEVARKLGRKLILAIKVNEQAEHDYWDQVLAPLLGQNDVEVYTDVRHKQKVDLMSHAAAVLLPLQWSEPFGLVMAEANACGTPAIAFARGAAPEIIEDGVTGYVVPPDDVGALCAAVEQVGDIDPAACRSRVEQHFSSERMVVAYEQAYRRVLEDHS